MSIFEMVRSITLDSLGIAISQLLADVSTVSEDMLTRDQQVTCIAVRAMQANCDECFEEFGRTTFESFWIA
jgi:hypothetical protein